MPAVGTRRAFSFIFCGKGFSPGGEAQTVKKAHCRGEHCSPVPVRPVRSFPKRALLRQVGGRTMFAPTFSIKQSRCFLTYCSPIGLQYQPRLKAHNERRQPHVASLFYLLILPSVGISGESSSSKSATFLNGSSYSLKLNWSHIWSFTSRSLMYLFIASAVSFCKKLQLFFSANASYCRARSGLAAPSCCPCRAH